MHEDIALRRTAQGQNALYRLEVTADELDQDSCPVEVIPITANLDWRLHHLHRGGVVRVRRIVPCSFCGAPIAVLRLETERTLRICDAVEDSFASGLWTSNIFVMHECAEVEQ